MNASQHAVALEEPERSDPPEAGDHLPGRSAGLIRRSGQGAELYRDELAEPADGRQRRHVALVAKAESRICGDGLDHTLP